MVGDVDSFDHRGDTGTGRKSSPAHPIPASGLKVLECDRVVDVPERIEVVGTHVQQV